MRLGRFSFAPAWWSIVLVVVMAALLAGLGVWQIERAETKQDLMAQREQARQAPPQPFAAAAGPDAAPAYEQRYIVQGRLDAAHQVLLDNQVLDERVGYHVWTPMVLDDGRRVMIDRGWIPLGPKGRAEPPDPAGPQEPVELTGLWRSLPQPGFRLGEGRACDLTDWPRVLNYPTHAQLACQYEAAVFDGVLLLDPGAAHGFERDWDRAMVHMPPTRHLGYALQWFGLALALLVLFVFIHLRRVS